MNSQTQSAGGDAALARDDSRPPRFEKKASTQAGAEVIAADDKRYDAMVSQDWAQLENLLHNDLVYTHSNGDRDGKDSYLEKVTSGRPVYLGFDLQERFVAAWGGVVLLHGRVSIEVDVRGEIKTIDLLFQNLWERVDGAWKMLGWSCTKTNTAA